MKIHIKNGRVIDPMNARDEVADVFVAAGKIVGNGHAPADFHANRTIDATGLVVCPGLVDLSVRLREPGFEYRATLESEMLAAAAGGITSLACPPDTDPPLDEPGLVEMLKFRAKNLPGPRVYPIGAMTQKLEGQMLTEMAELTEAGCRAFTQADAPMTDTQVLLRAMEYAATFGFSLWLRPQDAVAGARRRRARRRGGLAAWPARHSGAGRNGGAGNHPAAGTRDRRTHSSCATVDARGHRHGARGQGAGAGGHLRRRQHPRAPVGKRPHRLRFAPASGAAAAGACATAMPSARRCATVPSTRCAPTTRRSTRTRSRCRSANRRPAPPGSSCCCR